ATRVSLAVATGPVGHDPPARVVRWAQTAGRFCLTAARPSGKVCLFDDRVIRTIGRKDRPPTGSRLRCVAPSTALSPGRRYPASPAGVVLGPQRVASFTTPPRNCGPR